jgi:DNA-binding GntR family transcriptional regulator
MATKKNLRTSAYEKIRNGILSGELRQGERIFTMDLSKKFAISPTPVREALLLLCQEKLVASDTRNGFTVRRVDLSELEEFFYFRELLENTSVPLILKNITDADVKILDRLIEKAEHVFHKNKLYQFAQLHMEFHQKLWQSTKSSLYVDLMSSMNHILIQIISIGAKTTEGVETAVNGHKGIMESLKSGDQKKLNQLMVQHIHDAKKYIMPLYSLL